jgi:hypothetical protein
MGTVSLIFNYRPRITHQQPADHPMMSDNAALFPDLSLHQVVIIFPLFQA